MSYTNHHILMSAGWVKTMKADGSDGIALVQPPNNHTQDRATSLAFVGAVAAVTGAPSAWAWRCKPQRMVPHHDMYQFSTPRWVDVDPADEMFVTEGVTVDGAWWVIADQGSALVHDFSIEIPDSRGRSFRLQFDIPYNGSTVPGVRSSLLLTERGE